MVKDNLLVGDLRHAVAAMTIKRTQLSKDPGKRRVPKPNHAACLGLQGVSAVALSPQNTAHQHQQVYCCQLFRVQLSSLVPATIAGVMISQRPRARIAYPNSVPLCSTSNPCLSLHAWICCGLSMCVDPATVSSIQTVTHPHHFLVVRLIHAGCNEYGRLAVKVHQLCRL